MGIPWVRAYHRNGDKHLYRHLTDTLMWHTPYALYIYCSWVHKCSEKEVTYQAAIHTYVPLWHVPYSNCFVFRITWKNNKQTTGLTMHNTFTMDTHNYITMNGHCTSFNITVEWNGLTADCNNKNCCSQHTHMHTSHTHTFKTHAQVYNRVASDNSTTV